jgi:tRNA modification GTPase TrmE
MSNVARDTIYALSSGRPPAAIAVVRISGPRAGDALNALMGRIPDPRKAALARVRGRDGEIIDQALALWFPGPQSETGEDVAELQLHGGRAIIAAVMAALSDMEGLRPAEAGEFTRRAFENGKLDLTAVEGLADLVMAETEGQRRQAFRQMTGGLGERAEKWRTQLIQALALIEARIDFSDEADVPQDLVTPALQIAHTLEAEMASVLADGGCGERLREGFVVAIAGPPNAGKSTLLNRIAKRDAAIVSPYAGTTRDVIEVHLDLRGLPVTLLDTAGIRETEDPVELEGVRRARERAAAANLILWIVDSDDWGQEAAEEVANGTKSTKGADWSVAVADAEGSSKGREHDAGRFSNAGDNDAAFSSTAPYNDDAGRSLAPRENNERSSKAPDNVGARSSTGPDSEARRSFVSRENSERSSTPRDNKAARSSTAPDKEAALSSQAREDDDVASKMATPLWRVRSKIDLGQGVGARSEQEVQDNLKSEPVVQTNRKLKNKVKDRLIGRTEFEFNSSESIFNISAKTGEGIETLLDAVALAAKKFLAGTESALVTRARHRHTLNQALEALRRARPPGLLGQDDLLAEELRIAGRALGRLTGRVDVEDVLDVIFRDFCVGK